MALMLVIVTGFFSIRGIILRKAINDINRRMGSREYISHWDGARFKGLKTIFVREIFVQSKSKNNEAYIDSLSIKVRLLPLLVKNVRIRKIDCKSISVRYNSDSVNQTNLHAIADTNTHFDFLINRDISDFTYKNIRRFFNYIPSRVNIGKIEVRYGYKGNTTMAALNEFHLRKGKMTAMVKIAGDTETIEIPLTGKLDKATSIIELNLTNADTSLLPVPLLKDKYGFQAGFDSLAFHLDVSDKNRHRVHLKGQFSITGFELKGQRLSTDNITINQFKSSFGVNIGSHYLEIDSSTIAYLNTIRLNPYLRISLEHNPVINIKVLPVSWNAADFFNSLPQGMFTSLTGLKAEGLLHYYLNFSVDLSNPDSLKFDTRLTSDNLKIAEFGIDDYRSMNGSFTHRVYEKGRLVASFLVGSENPDFVSLESISKFLRAAVMTSEDGSFYYHNGFNPEAFRESIVTNIKEKRFARGGSTITMQLVKNVFLTRNKTLARKIEEALIVWLIETKNLVPKQRMYEVYLNIIEWGPGVYGINQASHFYFDKNPANLDLQESVYLASIVPHPKWYKYTFVTNGVPRPFYGNYFNRMKQLMVRKEFILPGDTTNVRPEVVLKGSAARVFAASDSVVVDSVGFNELDLIPLF
jgi:hypothetical protein